MLSKSPTNIKYSLIKNNHIKVINFNSINATEEKSDEVKNHPFGGDHFDDDHFGGDHFFYDEVDTAELKSDDISGVEFNISSPKRNKSVVESSKIDHFGCDYLEFSDRCKTLAYVNGNKTP